MGDENLMFKEMTYERLLHQALANVPNDLDKRQGSVIYDAIAPICAELAQTYIDLSLVLKESFADTCSREYLIKRASERGLTPYNATNAIILANLSGDFILNGGERFSSDGLSFRYTGEVESGYYKLECESKGESGNLSYGELLPIENIPGLETASIAGVSFFARNEEDTEKFRKRYFKTFQSQAFGGNRADYLDKINNLNNHSEIALNGGIGGCKIYRAETEGENIKIVLIDSGYSAPSQKLLDAVKEKIDPTDSSGEGYGFAPIGHKVSVLPIGQVFVKFSARLTLRDGYTFNDISNKIEQAIDSHLLEIKKAWADTDEGLIIRISYLESQILAIQGVLDIANTKINGKEQNFILEKDFIPMRLGGFDAE